MNATFRYPSPDEIQAGVRRGQRERSEFITRCLARLVARLTGRRPAVVETLPTPVRRAVGADDHRLAA